MSDHNKTADPTQIRECDGALDYLYGMLEGQDKVRFEVHLAGCASCQAELEGMGRALTVAREVLPRIEPTERLTGALHAQLMHAAAQRKPKGKILPFVRRVVSHPGYAVAASVLIIGGVVGVQWSRGALMMPAKHAEAPATSVSAPAEAAPVVVAAPAGVPSPSPDYGKLAGLKEQEKAQEPFKVTTAAPTPVAKDAKEGGGGWIRDKKETPDRRAEHGRVDDPLAGLLRGDDKGTGASAPTTGNVTARAKTESAGKQAVAQNFKPEATDGIALNDSYRPAAPPAKKAAPVGNSANYLAPAATTRGEEAAPAQAAAPPPPASSATREAKSGMDERQVASNSGNRVTEDDKPALEPSPSVPEPTAKNDGDPIDAERARATKLAQAGRCDEAATAFEGLERRAPQRLNAQDRLAYAHCLRTLGRLDPAQNELDQLNGNQRNLPMAAPRAVQAEQNALNKQKAASTSYEVQRHAAKKRPKTASGAASNADVSEPSKPAAAKPADKNNSQKSSY